MATKKRTRHGKPRTYAATMSAIPSEGKHYRIGDTFRLGDASAIPTSVRTRYSTPTTQLIMELAEALQHHAIYGEPATVRAAIVAELTHRGLL